MSRLLSSRELVAKKQYDCDVAKIVIRDFGSFEEAFKECGLEGDESPLNDLGGDDLLRYQILKDRGFTIGIGDKYIHKAYIDDEGFFKIARYHQLCCQLVVDSIYDEG